MLLRVLNRQLQITLQSSFPILTLGTDQETKTFADDETLTITRNSDSVVLVTAKSISASSTGTGLGVSSSEGIVYHKGNFIRSREQVGVVSKYTTEPTIRDWV